MSCSFDPLIIIGICSPVVICLGTLSLLLFPTSHASTEHLLMGQAAHVMIFYIGLAFVPEAFVSVLFADVMRQWNMAFEISAFLGIVGYISLSVVARRMERNRQRVWTTRRIRYALWTAFLLDLAQVLCRILLVQEEQCEALCDDRQAERIVEMIRVFMPAIRVLLLMSLLLLLAVARIDGDGSLGQDGERQPLLGDDALWTGDLWWTRRS